MKKSVYVILLLLSIILGQCSASTTIRNIPESSKKILFVGEYRNHSVGKSQRWKPWQTGIAEMITDDLFSIGYFKLSSQESRSLALEELAFQQSGLTAKNSLKIGRMLGAEWIVSGSFTVHKDTLLVQSKVFEVETSRILASSRASGQVRDFFLVVKKNSTDLLSQFSFNIKESEIQIINNRVETRSWQASLKNYSGERLLLQIDYLKLLRNKPGANLARLDQQIRELERKARQEFRAALGHDSHYTKAQLNLNKLTLMLPNSI